MSELQAPKLLRSERVRPRVSFLTVCYELMNQAHDSGVWGDSSELDLGFTVVVNILELKTLIPCFFYRPSLEIVSRPSQRLVGRLFSP